MLRDSIHKVPLDVTSGGGYYEFKNVRTEKHTFLDIQILIDGGVNKVKDFNVL